MQKISLYIHIPFCKSKCLYCDFPSFQGKENLRMNYINALVKEIEIKGSSYIIDTIFIGGGTPTYLPLEALNVLGACIKKLNFSPDYEFTVECNPGTLNREKLAVLKEMGVNRLSIGLQAFQNERLKSLGRIHSVEEFLKNYNLARESGFHNINIDIMFGLPNQTLEEWEDTLIHTVKLNPEHISSYSLIIEEGTPFYDSYFQGKLNTPEEEIERKMYSRCIDILRDYGYHQYEISNFSKENKECRHNLVYWNLEEYLGCGSGAHSYVKNTRYRNEETIEKYILLMENRKDAVVEAHNNSLKDNMEEFMFMGLRKIEGISVEDFKKKFHKDIYSVYKEAIERHSKEELLVNRQGRIFLTPKGIELSNYVMTDFILT